MSYPIKFKSILNESNEENILYQPSNNLNKIKDVENDWINIKKNMGLNSKTRKMSRKEYYLDKKRLSENDYSKLFQRNFNDDLYQKTLDQRIFNSHFNLLKTRSEKEFENINNCSTFSNSLSCRLDYPKFDAKIKNEILLFNLGKDLTFNKKINNSIKGDKPTFLFNLKQSKNRIDKSTFYPTLQNIRNQERFQLPLVKQITLEDIRKTCKNNQKIEESSAFIQQNSLQDFNRFNHRKFEFKEFQAKIVKQNTVKKNNKFAFTKIDFTIFNKKSKISNPIKNSRIFLSNKNITKLNTSISSQLIKQKTNKENHTNKNNNKVNSRKQEIIKEIGSINNLKFQINRSKKKKIVQRNKGISEIHKIKDQNMKSNVSMFRNYNSQISLESPNQQKTNKNFGISSHLLKKNSTKLFVNEKSIPIKKSDILLLYKSKCQNKDTKPNFRLSDECKFDTIYNFEKYNSKKNVDSNKINESINIDHEYKSECKLNQSSQSFLKESLLINIKNAMNQ